MSTPNRITVETNVDEAVAHLLRLAYALDALSRPCEGCLAESGEECFPGCLAAEDVAR